MRWWAKAIFKNAPLDITCPRWSQRTLETDNDFNIKPNLNQASSPVNKEKHYEVSHRTKSILNELSSALLAILKKKLSLSQSVNGVVGLFLWQQPQETKKMPSKIDKRC